MLNMKNNRQSIIKFAAFIGILLIILIWQSIFRSQSQYISRSWTGIPVKINLPANCISDYQFSFTKDDNITYKYVTCKNKDWIWMTKEYNDYGVLEGSIEWTK